MKTRAAVSVGRPGGEERREKKCGEAGVNGVVAPNPDRESRARPAEFLDGIRAATVGGRARGRREGAIDSDESRGPFRFGGWSD